MTNSPNKNYSLQVTGSNTGTWGTVLNNSVFSIIDSNLGGTLAINVGGNSNINLTAAQAQSLIHNLTGVLTGNIQYIFPAQGGFFAINNQTTGAFTVTVSVVGGSGGIIVPQGSTTTVYIDATVPAVYGFTGSLSSFTAASVGGTANAITIAATTPANFTLVTGTFLTFFATGTNTTAVTITTPDGSTKTLKKISPSGLVDLDIGDTAAGIPIVALYNGTVWINTETIYEGKPQVVSTGQSLGFTALFNSYVATAPLSLTISRTATTLPPYWWIEGNALGGAITIVPDSHDAISVNGATLAANTPYVVAQGGTFKLSTDSNGNLYILFLQIPVTFTTPAQGDYSTKPATTQFFTQNLTGGFVNKFRNATLDINNRGLSGTITAGSPSYTSDGWIIGCTGANVTWSVASDSGGTSVAYNDLIITGASSITDTFFRQRIESYLSASLTGQPITVQFSVVNRSGGTITPTLTVKHPTSQDNYGATGTDVNAASLQSITNNTSGELAYTFSSASAYLGLEITLDFGAVLNSGAKTIIMRGGLMDIRATPGVTTGATNSAPPPPEQRPVESALCSRYLPAFNVANTITLGTVVRISIATVGFALVQFPAEKRVAPTGASVSSASHFSSIKTDGSLVAASTLSFNTASTKMGTLNLTSGASTFTVGGGSLIQSNNASGQVLFTGAEL